MAEKHVSAPSIDAAAIALTPKIILARAIVPNPLDHLSVSVAAKLCKGAISMQKTGSGKVPPPV
jgi:hypothetical protein